MAPLLAAPARDGSFERMYEKYARDVYRYALAVLQNPADAEDVTQTTFLNAYRSYVGGARPEKPKHWLITIAHNVCRQRFRQSLRRPHEVMLQEEIAEAAVPDEQYSVDDIRRGLSQLSFNQRSALVMRELEDRSYADIAEALGLSISAVETLLFRARRALREQLEGTLTCHEAELALSKQVDGRLTRAEKSQLRAHLRGCAVCATFARSQRAQKSAWKALAAIPLPSSLASWFGGGSAAVGTGVAVKAAAVTLAGVAVVGGTYELAGEDVFLGSTDSAQVAKLQRSLPQSRRGTPAATSFRIVDKRGVEGGVAAVFVERPKAHTTGGTAAEPHSPRVAKAKPRKHSGPAAAKPKPAAAAPTPTPQTPAVSEGPGVAVSSPGTTHHAKPGKSRDRRGDEQGAGDGGGKGKRATHGSASSAKTNGKGASGHARGHDKDDQGPKGAYGSETHGNSAHSGKGEKGEKGKKEQAERGPKPDHAQKPDKGEKPDHGKGPDEQPEHGQGAAAQPAPGPVGQDSPSAVPTDESPAQGVEEPTGNTDKPVGVDQSDKPDTPKPDTPKPDKPGKPGKPGKSQALTLRLLGL